MSQVNNSVEFSLLADEAADIAGKESLSIERRMDLNSTVQEEILGYREIQDVGRK